MVVNAVAVLLAALAALAPHHRHHHRHHHRRPRPMLRAVASFYYDQGQTASGWHAFYGVADCGSSGPCFSFGTRIRFCFHGRCVTATVDDHGPYVSGRSFDLNEHTAAALGFSGVQTVGYRVGG